jgi:acetyltransferase-like isoleucine patch superfamily enzyme
MSFMSKLMALFPFTVYLLLAGSIYNLCFNPSLFALLGPIFVLYLYPVIVYRIINILSPLKEGVSDIMAKGYNPWWGSHMIQSIYFACPWLEGILRTIPGAYSFWLRLWGAKVGKNIYWTPNIEIDDRPLIEIGSHCIVGHKLHFLPHVITPRDGIMSLYVKKIKIGNECFLGAGSRLGPGVIIDDKTSIPILTDGQINQHFSTGNHIKT